MTFIKKHLRMIFLLVHLTSKCEKQASLLGTHTAAESIKGSDNRKAAAAETDIARYPGNLAAISGN